MRLLKEDTVTLEWSDINGRVEHPAPLIEPRAPGYHVSGILRQVALRSGHLNKKWAHQDVDDMAICIAVGFAWESWAVGLYPNMFWQPGSACVDDIHGNIDGLTSSDNHFGLIMDGLDIREVAFPGEPAVIIEEFKATWKSHASHPILSMWMWMCQAMAYCYMYRTNFVRFHVLWVAGNYRPPTPLYHRYIIEFTRAELDNNWDILKRNKHLAIPE